MNFDAALGFTMIHKQDGITVAAMGFITNLKMGIMCFFTPIRYKFELFFGLLCFVGAPFSIFSYGGAGLIV